jgi:peptidoglycan/LPS O-acetylase OafA/YrhL
MAMPDAWHSSRAFLPYKAHYFAVGIASAAWIDRGTIRSFGLILAAALVLCAARGGLDKLLPPLVWTLCLAAQLGIGPSRLIAAPLGWRSAQWLGAISYPIYLANEPIQKLFGFVLARVAAGDGMVFTVLWIPAAVLLPIGVAMLLHRYVEVPFQKWGHILARRGTRYAGAPVRML